MDHSFAYDRDYDVRYARRRTQGMFGWMAMCFMSYGLFGLNAFLLIVYPTVGLLHSIVGTVLGIIMVVGSTANLMGYFYEDGR